MSTSLVGTTGHSSGGGYPEIARAIREQIGRGLLGRGERLPPISELARRCGTTAITIRRALRLLEEEGLVRVEHGVGTFVADWSRRYETFSLPSFSEEMASRNIRAVTEIRGRAGDVHNPRAALALGLEPGARAALLERLRKIDGVPVVFQRSWLSMELREAVEGYSPDRSLYELLRERSGRMATGAEERLRVAALPARAARELGRAEGSLGWISLRTTFDSAGEPMVYDEAFFAADGMEVRILRRAGRTDVEYRPAEREPGGR